MSDEPWIQTVSGVKFPLLDPKPEHFRLSDIAWHLSRINRFTGAIECQHYSVAEHSMYVADWVLAKGQEARMMVPDAMLLSAGLMHDAHEAYLGDLSAPLKWVMRDLGSRVYDELCDHYQDIINKKYGIVKLLLGPKTDVVKEADLAVLETEKNAKYVMADYGYDWHIPRKLTSAESWRPDPLSWGMSPTNACNEFLAYAKRAGLSDE